MKKFLSISLLFSFLTFANSTFADDDIEVYGKVTAISMTDLTFDIERINTKTVQRFKVDDRTKIEIDYRAPGKKDERTNFSEIKVGDDVKIEYYPNSHLKDQLAREIEIRR